LIIERLNHHLKYRAVHQGFADRNCSKGYFIDIRGEREIFSKQKKFPHI